MFENVRADIDAGVLWHPVRGVRDRYGANAERAAVVLLSPALQVVLIYRLQAWCRQRGIPLVPNLCRRLTMMIASVSIGDETTIGPGLLIAHGNVVIDGPTRIGADCQISPFVTIGLDTGGPNPDYLGPDISWNVFIGTGAKILGHVGIGHNARIGANAVVLTDIPPDTTAVGAPARAIPHESVLGPAVKRGDPE